MVTRAVLASFSKLCGGLFEGEAICKIVSTLERFSGSFLPSVKQHCPVPCELSINPKLLWIGCPDPPE